RLDLSGVSYISKIELQNNVAYLADTNLGLRVINLANPSNPVQIASFQEPSITSSVSCQSNRVFLTGAYGTDVLDVSNPANPARITLNNIFGSLTWLQNNLALGSSTDGLKIFDLLNPASPLI